MSATTVILLGAVAGLTVYCGLPIGRLRRPVPRLRAFLNATAIGVLVFLLWDILDNAVSKQLDAYQGRWGDFAGLAVLLAVGLGVGMLGLVYYDRWTARRRARFGPGAAAVDEFRHPELDLRAAAYRLSLLIAIGIGLHNFSEGLAIGQSAASGAIGRRLAVMLVIGFGLHNATEGFGIVGPLAAERERPSWRYIGLMGLIAGGPTFVGTVIGRSFVSRPLSILFLALAAGSILYVVTQLLGVASRLAQKEILYWGLLTGLLLGFGTDFVLSAAGL